MTAKPPKEPHIFCCDRFEHLYNENDIHYAYLHSDEIDETEWLIEMVGHLYYCPFCGAFIKGFGFGEYDSEHPPLPEQKHISQTILE